MCTNCICCRQTSQTLFLYLRPDCWAHYGITAISDSNWRRRTGDVSWPRPQEGTAGSSHSRQLHGDGEEPQPGRSSAPEILSFLPDSQSMTSPMADEALERPHHLETTKNTTGKGIGMMKCNSKSVNLQKSVPLCPHIWSSLFPPLNYNVINLVNNNYIFHYRIARKGRCKTLSQDSPLSCLVSVCLFN